MSLGYSRDEIHGQISNLGNHKDFHSSVPETGGKKKKKNIYIYINKSKNKHTGSNQTYKLLHSKGIHKQNADNLWTERKKLQAVELIRLNF